MINSRAWKTSNHGLFTKEQFGIALGRRRVTCPAGKSAPIKSGQATFDLKDCGRCALKKQCTKSARRSVQIHAMEDLLITLRRNANTRAGREQLRIRTGVEHRLARVGAIQGPRARFRTRRKNELDLNNTAALANLLETAHRRCA